MIFLTEVCDDSLGGSHEVILINLVRNVSVKVILEMLEHVHVVNYGIVSSNSWERESSVVEFPSVNLWNFLSHLSSDLDGVVQVFNIEVSRELIGLPSQFIVTDPESLITSSWVGFNLIDNTRISFTGVGPSLVKFDGGGHSD